MKKKRLLFIPLFVIIIGAILVTVNLNKNKKLSTPIDNQNEENIEVKSIEDENKEIDKIEIIDIESPNKDLMSITLDNQNISSNVNTNINQSDSTNYELINIKHKKTDKHSVVTGTIKNKSGQENLIIRVEYYNEENKKIGADSITIQGLKEGSSKEFEIRTQKNISTDNYKIFTSILK